MCSIWRGSVSYAVLNASRSVYARCTSMLTMAGRAPKPNFARLGFALTCSQYWRAVRLDVSITGMGSLRCVDVGSGLGQARAFVAYQRGGQQSEHDQHADQAESDVVALGDVEDLGGDPDAQAGGG